MNVILESMSVTELREELAKSTTRLQQVEADAAVMRLLLSAEGCLNPECGGKGWYEVSTEGPHAEPKQEQRQCQWCCEKSEALATNAGKSLLERLKEAEMLLRDVDNEELDSEAWAQRRDAFLNPTNKDVM